MEYLDVCDENGRPTGAVVERDQAHREGILHRTVHIWIARREAGQWQVLLQKRSRNKDSNPGMFDTSSAGHIDAGEEPLPSALRELEEELGLSVRAEELREIGHVRVRFDKDFHGWLFRDNEYVHVYACTREVDAASLRLQESELETVCWFALDDVLEQVRQRRGAFCIPLESLELLRDFLHTLEPFVPA